MSDEDCYPRDVEAALRAAVGGGVDPSGVPWAELDPARLREQRSSIKWTRFPADTLPLFVAEMDFAVAPEIRAALIARIDASDIGYLDGPGPLAPAFAEFARDRWGWEVPTSHVHLATDVATGVVETLRVSLGRLSGRDSEHRARLALPTPVYPGFFEMLQEVPFDVVELPLQASSVEGHSGLRLDLESIAREFASGHGVDAFLLCNPHNPHGLLHRREDLTELARLAAQYDVFVISDEIHAPLSHSGREFIPFAPLAARAGALAVTVTSASKGWNLAGVKCSVIVAADERANEALQALPPETTTRASILGLHANVAAFEAGRGWLDRAVAQIELNAELLVSLVGALLPGVTVVRPEAGYLAWLDLRETGLGDDPYSRILHDARVAANDGSGFGLGGAGHVRVNLACAPATLVAAVERIATILPRRIDHRRGAGR